MNIDPAALHALCAHSLTGYKRPTSIHVVDAIAKNAVGKIDKASLRAAHPRRIAHDNQEKGMTGYAGALSSKAGPSKTVLTVIRHPKQEKEAP